MNLLSKYPSVAVMNPGQTALDPGWNTIWEGHGLEDWLRGGCLLKQHGTGTLAIPRVLTPVWHLTGHWTSSAPFRWI